MASDRITALERECTRLRGLLKGYAGGALIDELARMDRALADEQRWRRQAEQERDAALAARGDEDAAAALDRDEPWDMMSREPCHVAEDTTCPTCGLGGAPP